MRIISGAYPENSAATLVVGSELPSSAPVSPLSSAKQANMQSSILHPAAAELAKLPDVDLERIAEIKAALSRGEINFNPSKLATLIERYHTGR
jgi:negative regulator of flagellin synthesis FlgM